jgi:tetratricopeptide (TPR) repeat protein
LTTKYPTDPRAFEMLSKALMLRGDWRDAVSAIERAIALDSASEPVERQNCRLCGDLGHLADIYIWWDSLPAAERTARRFLRVRPAAHNPWDVLGRLAAARGDTVALRTYLRRFHEANPVETAPMYFVRRAMLAEEYEQAERDLQRFLDSPRRAEASEARWLQSIVLRNQGRVNELLRQKRSSPGSGDFGAAMAALELGNARPAMSFFGGMWRSDESQFAPGLQARHHAWSRTLYGMALAAGGDTLAVRRLADSVEYWGRRSLYGRDRRAHHYLRGMVLVAAGRDAAAAGELREAIHSPTNGFTRVNYELGKALMRLNRPAEAVPVVRAALHGDIDGSNLYVTRTDLHELLARAFDQLGRRDSAAVHYRAVLNAWAHADPVFRARRDRASSWLANNSQSQLH